MQEIHRNYATNLAVFEGSELEIARFGKSLQQFDGESLTKRFNNSIE